MMRLLVFQYSSLSLLCNETIAKLPGCFLNLLEILSGLFVRVKRRFMLRMQRELNTWQSGRHVLLCEWFLHWLLP